MENGPSFVDHLSNLRDQFLRGRIEVTAGQDKWIDLDRVWRYIVCEKGVTKEQLNEWKKANKNPQHEDVPIFLPGEPSHPRILASIVSQQTHVYMQATEESSCKIQGYGGDPLTSLNGTVAGRGYTLMEDDQRPIATFILNPPDKLRQGTWCKVTTAYHGPDPVS